MRLLAEGLTNKQIAQKLGISNYTVRDHLSSVFEKTDVKNRVELAVLATKISEDSDCSVSKL